MKKFLLLAAFPAALAAQQSVVAGLRPISMQDAIALAQQNQPTSIAARNSILTSKSSVKAGYSQFIPSLNWNMNQNQSAGPRQGPDGTIIPYVAQPWTYNEGFTASLTLFNGGKMFSDITSRKANVTSMEAAEIAQRFTIALAVKTQYYAVLQAEEQESAAQSQLQQAVEQLKVSEAKLLAGATTRSDSLRSAIAVGSARLALLQAQNAVQVASATLTRLVGSDSPLTANPADTLDRPLSAIDSVALAELASNGPAVQQQDATVRSLQATTRSQRAAYLPTIAISYTRNGTGADKYFGIGGGDLAYSRGLSLSLSYPIFNQWQREDLTLNANINEQNAEATLRDLKLGQQQQLVQYITTLSSTAEQLKIQEASIEAAQEDLRVQNQRYAVGASVLLDVLTSQAALIQARLTLIQTRFTYRTTKAQLEQLIGRDLH